MSPGQLAVKQYQPGIVSASTMNVSEVAVHSLPEEGQLSAAEPCEVQLVLVLTLALGPQIWNETFPCGAGAVGRTKGEMSTVAVSVTEPDEIVPNSLDRVVSVLGCWTKKHSLVVAMLEEPV